MLHSDWAPAREQATVQYCMHCTVAGTPDSIHVGHAGCSPGEREVVVTKRPRPWLWPRPCCALPCQQLWSCSTRAQNARLVCAGRGYGTEAYPCGYAIMQTRDMRPEEKHVKKTSLDKKMCTANRERKRLPHDHPTGCHPKLCAQQP